MECVSRLPDELKRIPKPFVVFTGLEKDNNKLHASIWKSFNKLNVSNSAQLSLQCHPIDHKYPISKQKKKEEYDWSVPKGFIKTNWLRKHLSVIPAVVAIFFDLDWDDQEWPAKLERCCCYVKLVRERIAGRPTKVVVVLVQTRVCLPMVEDVTAMERAQEFCARADVMNKQLFVLPDADNLFGYISRLNEEFRSLAVSYYSAAARKVRQHCDGLNKVSHQLLFVRLEFKIGFFNEMKLDTKTAFKQAYNCLLDCHKSAAHMMEIKTVAAWLNYKVCRLAFGEDARDAIQHFRRHIDSFRAETGDPQLQFEHEAWMSRQFEIFGDLFSEKHVSGLVTQHPGLYYQEAARHAIARRQAAAQLPADEPPAEEQPEEEEDPAPPTTEFVGQRAWREGVRSLEPPDQARERSAVRALQRRESHVNHSRLVVPLLEKAHRHFRLVPAPRMRLFMAVQLADEHLLIADFAKAHDYLVSLVDEFRRDGHERIFTAALSKLLHCACELGQVAEFCGHCLELLERRSALEAEARRSLQQHGLEAVLLGRAPRLPGADEERQERLQALWTERLAAAPCCLNATDLRSFLSCKASFVARQFASDRPVQLLVFFRSTAPLPVRLARVTVELAVEAAVTTCEWTPAFPLGPEDALRALRLSCRAPASGLVKIAKVSAQLLPPKDEEEEEEPEEGVAPMLILSWSFSQPARHATSFAPDPSAVETAFEDEDRQLGLPSLPQNWDSIANFCQAEVVGRQSRMEVQFELKQPALMNEAFPVRCRLVSREEGAPRHVRLVAQLLQEGRSARYAGQSAARTLQPVADRRVPQPSFPSGGGGAGGGGGGGGEGDKAADLTSIAAPSCAVWWGGSTGRRASAEHSLDWPDQEEAVEAPLFLRSASQGTRRLQLTVRYQMDVQTQRPPSLLLAMSGANCARRSMRYKLLQEQSPPEADYTVPACRSVCTASLSVTFIKPFEISWHTMTLLQKPISEVVVRQPFLVQLNIQNSSPWPIRVLRGSFLLGDDVRFADASNQSTLKEPLRLRSFESMSEVRLLSVHEDLKELLVKLGRFRLEWCREEEEEEADYEFPLEELNVVQTAIRMRLQLPACAVVLKPLALTYELCVADAEEGAPQPLRLEVSGSPDFAFAGAKRAALTLVPGVVHRVCQQVVPLRPGYLQLPRLRLLPAASDGPPDDELAARDLPTHIYVLPSGNHSEVANA